MRSYKDYIARKEREYGSKFDSSDLAKKFIPYFESGQRIKVRTLGREITGTVSVTGGWRPSFLLMRRSNAIGSEWTLSNRDKIIAVQKGGKYIPVRP